MSITEAELASRIAALSPSAQAGAKATLDLFITAAERGDLHHYRLMHFQIIGRFLTSPKCRPLRYGLAKGQYRLGGATPQM